MTSAKAVNHDQGTLAPPQRSNYEEVEAGAFFRPPEVGQLDPEVAQEITKLEFAAKALKNLANQSMMKGFVVSAENTLLKVRVGEEELSPEAEDDLIERRKKSADDARSLSLAAKTNFARSIDIEVERREEDGTDGEPVTKIVAKDPARRAELNTAYMAFRAAYAERRNAKRRNKRRAEIAEQVAAMKVSSR